MKIKKYGFNSEEKFEIFNKKTVTSLFISNVLAKFEIYLAYCG